MAERRVNQRSHVGGGRRRPPGQQRPRLRPQHQLLRGPRSRSPGDPVVDEARRACTSRPAGGGQSHGVPHHLLGDRHLLHHLVKASHVGPREQGLDLFARARGGPQHHRHLVVLGEVVDQHIEHEAVELRLGQWVGPLHLNRVLCRQHEERFVQLIPPACHRHLVLLHRLEQGRLRFGRGSVDLVGENHVAKDRPFDKLQPTLPVGQLLENLGPRDVGGHQVGGELDPLELEIEDLGERPHQQRLRQPRGTGHQAVTTGEQADQQLLDHVRLADNGLGQLGINLPPAAPHLGHRLGFPPDRVVCCIHGIASWGVG